jgi:hypothetical protein
MNSSSCQLYLKYFRALLLVFVVPQVDEEGYVLTDAFANAVSNLYTEDSLKTLAKELAPHCITEANAGVKGRYKSQQTLI